MATKIGFNKQKGRSVIRAPDGKKSLYKTLKPIHNKNNKKNNMAKKIYTAICFFPVEQNKRPHKYRNVSTPARLTLYMKRQGAEYINFYDADTAAYEFRFYCNPEYERRRQAIKIKQKEAIKQTNEFTKFMNNLKMTK